MRWRPLATIGTASVLLLLGSLILAVPDALPGLTIPMDEMPGM
jgi:hypothetical protein